ncbi:MAG TPA: alpha/beta hydrolase [Edaphobacter sp.]|nr:alpha/beta hydrolase [Edaphobacter sp.]
MNFSENATVVLVHGAWADGSSWQAIIRPLQERGLNVIAAPIPLTSLSDDAAALKRSIARTQGPVIVAGHAYAGAVIATANDERVKALVYIAALAPDEGETVAQVFYKDETHPKAPQLAPDTDGFIWMPDEGFTNAFAQNATTEQLALSKAVQRPISVKSIQEPVPAPAWKSKPTWYLVAEEDRMINPKTQHFMAKRMKATVKSFAVDHTPLLTAPDKVVDVILEAAKATLS